MKLKSICQEQKAITLIALIITIIVMIIIAGVTINLTLGENGIFTTAQKVAQNYTGAQNKELEYLERFENEVNNIVNPAQLGTVIRTENNINYIADGAGNTIPVPVGFEPITTSDQGTKLTGFVIKDVSIDSAGNPTETNGNEFVWVPVEGMSYTYNRYDFGKQNGNYSDYSESMPADEQTSVATYGGFYIGRYEAGIKDYDEENVSTEKDGTENWTGYTGENIKLVVQDDQQVWNYITRNRAIAEAEKLYNKEENNVKSKLCSSYAWDTALKFIETQNSFYPTNSEGGNYTVATGGTGVLQRTGYHVVNNIYDMGGNVWEWTTEIYNDTDNSGVCCGGSYYSAASKQSSAFCRELAIADVSPSLSFRVTLFI